MNFYVYAHYDCFGSCFYIGKGKDSRVFSNVGRNKYWKNISKLGITRIILFDNLSEQEAFDLEILLIERYAPVANLTKGGTGGCMVLTLEAKAKMAEKVSKKQKLRWSKLDLEKRRAILKPANSAHCFKKMTKEELSKEQKRRSSFRALKKVYCESNNITYSSAKEACKALGIVFTRKMYAACAGKLASFKGYKFKYIS